MSSVNDYVLFVATAQQAPVAAAADAEADPHMVQSSKVPSKLLCRCYFFFCYQLLAAHILSLFITAR